MGINEITGIIIEESIRIHKDIGPGLMEKVYEELLAYRLKKRGLDVKRQQKIELVYEEVKLDVDLRFDLMVENKVLVDLKSKETVSPAEYKIFKTYLRLTEISMGLVINFNVEYLKDGIKRIANNYLDENK
jgi:GxxExxY protein